MAKKVAKLKKLVRSSLTRQLASASPDELDSLRAELERQREKRLRKMEKRGYRLEAVVGDVYGLFTRGAAVGTLQQMTISVEEPRASVAG